MEVKGKRQVSGDYILEVGTTILTLPRNALVALAELMNNRKNYKGASQYQARLQKRLATYRAFANKVAQLNDALVQNLLSQMSMEQMVTLARLGEGQKVYQKILANLSRQNVRQFEDDFQRLNKITVHQASAQMEQVVPIIQRAIKAQKY